MNDDTGAVLDAETPVNPYSLLEAVNASSRAASKAWLIYLALMAYLLVTVAGVSHQDLLLNNGVALPLLQLRIDLTRFFVAAPIVVVLLHVGLLAQLALLARKTLEFHAALRMLEATDERTHPLRLELDGFFLVQATAGSERSRVMSALLYGISWLTLVIVPVLLLAYVQVAFLPFHDVAITAVHRLAVLADILLLVLVGVFLTHPETSFIHAFWNTAVTHPFGFVTVSAALGLVALFSIFLATVPGEALDRFASAAADRRQGSGQEQAKVLGFAVPAFVATGDGALFGIFPRNLVVTDADLVKDRNLSPGRPTLNLRGRDLRFAKLDRSDLHQADLTAANLDGASLTGADLRGIWLQCADIDELLQRADREGARCAGSARGADFAKARLTEARMAGLDLRAARFDGAQLEGADLAHGVLVGASFLLANLQGADLAGAKLQVADLSSTRMQGANLVLASLEGALLRDADLEGANLQMVKLVGADLRGAKLRGADLAGAVVWRAAAPGSESAALGDLANIVMSPPNADDMGRLKAVVAGLDDGPLGSRLSGLFGSGADRGAAWTASSDGQAWASLLRASEAAMADGYKARLTEHLAKLACRSQFSSGAVAAGIARRAMAQGYKGDLVLLHDRLKAADCAGATAMPRPVLRDLATAADAVQAP
jgi:uncharacterized protein YjbI with pentapeptide repeats